MTITGPHGDLHLTRTQLGSASAVGLHEQTGRNMKEVGWEKPQEVTHPREGAARSLPEMRASGLSR